MNDRHADARRRHVRDREGEELLFNRALGSAVRERRTALGWTQDQLAMQAGMTRGSIANIERGEQVPGLYRLSVICTALNCRLDALLPPETFPAQSVAESIGGRYSTAVQTAKRKAMAQRVTAKSTS